MRTGVTINDVKRVDLPRLPDARGNLSFVEELKHIPFRIETAYWVNDVPGGEGVEGYSAKDSSELIISISGNFDVVVSDGYEEALFSLNRSYSGLYVPKMIWRRIESFSTNSLAFILSSSGDVNKDYIRDFEEFLTLKDCEKG